MAAPIPESEINEPTKASKTAAFSKQIPMEELFFAQDLAVGQAEAIVVPEIITAPEGCTSETTQVPEAVKISLRILPDDFTVCQITDPLEIPFSDTFVFVSKTDEELSLVCRTSVVPWKTKAREDGWRAVRIDGVLDFGLVGILAGIASILAAEGISIFAVSTYNTDYVLLKEDKLTEAQSVLSRSGYLFL